MKRDNNTNYWNYGCTKENVDELLAIYRNMTKEVEQLEELVPVRRFTLDGHIIGSIGEAIAAAYYNVQLAPISTKSIDGAFNNKAVQIKITQQDSVPLSFDGKGVEPTFLLVLYLNKDGSFYEVYNGPWRRAWSNSSNQDAHGYVHVCVSKLMELSKGLTEEEIIPQQYRVPKMTKAYRNQKSKKELDKKAIAAFAKKYYEIYKSAPDEIVESSGDEDFAEICWDLGFYMDTGNMFVAMYGDAFNSADKLQLVIDDVKDLQILGSAIFSKWRYITHWSYGGESLSSKESRKWFMHALNRLNELSN